MQHQITEKKPLLDEKGELTECGYATSLVLDYKRSAIRAAAHRIKEWDYYLISDGHYAVALTIDDNSYMGLDSISLLCLEEGHAWEKTVSRMQWLTFGKKGLPATSEEGDVASLGKGYFLSFERAEGKRVLTFAMDNFMDGKKIAGHFEIDCPQEDSLVIVTPYREDKKAFYYNQKINCMPAQGEVMLGDSVFNFSSDKTFATLDWGRGVWLYKGVWYWGTCSSLLDGERFGFNIGYGFGDTTAASENMLFYKGQSHKLDRLTINIPTKEDGTEDYLNRWCVTSSDGRFEMEFTPILDRASKTDVGVICSDQHQVFGKISGKAVLDDGTVLDVKDVVCAIEKVKNKW